MSDPDLKSPNGRVSLSVGPTMGPRERRIFLVLVSLLVSTAVAVGLVWSSTTLMIGAVLGTLGLLLVLSRPFVGLILFTVLFVLRPGELWPALGALRLERVIGSITLLGILMEQRHREGRIALDRSRQTLLLLGFVGAVALSVPFAYWRTQAAEGLTEVLRILAYYFMVAMLVNNHVRLRAFVGTFCVMIAFVCVSSLYEYFHGVSFFAQGIDRAVGITSFGENPNELGTTLASAFPIFFLLAFMRGLRLGRLVFGGLALAMVVGIVLTGSRASILGLTAGSAFLCWRSRHRVLALTMLLCLAIAGYAAMPKQYQSRYASIVKKSSRGREVMWFDGLKMLLDRPFFGVGINCYGTARGVKYAATPGDYMNAHSLYFQVIGELGLVGAVAFFSFLVEMLRMNRRTARTIARERPSWSFERIILDAIFAGLVALLISGIFGHSLLRRTWYVYAALGLAIFRIQAQSGRPEAVPERLEP